MASRRSSPSSSVSTRSTLPECRARSLSPSRARSSRSLNGWASWRYASAGLIASFDTPMSAERPYRSTGPVTSHPRSAEDCARCRNDSRGTAWSSLTIASAAQLHNVGRLVSCNVLGYTDRSDPQLPAQGVGQLLRDRLKGRRPTTTCPAAASRLGPVERRHVASRHGASRTAPSSPRG